MLENLVNSVHSVICATHSGVARDVHSPMISMQITEPNKPRVFLKIPPPKSIIAGKRDCSNNKYKAYKWIRQRVICTALNSRGRSDYSSTKNNDYAVSISQLRDLIITYNSAISSNKYNFSFFLY